MTNLEKRITSNVIQRIETWALSVLNAGYIIAVIQLMKDHPSYGVIETMKLIHVPIPIMIMSFICNLILIGYLIYEFCKSKK